MNEKHFSDDQIQEVLEHMALSPGLPLPAHLNACPCCRKRFEQYQQLFAGLAADPGFDLPPAFADAVLQRLPNTSPVFWARPAVWLALAVGALTLVLAAVFTFIDMTPLTGQLTRLAANLAGVFDLLPAQFRSLLARLNGYAHVFFLGGLSLLGAAFFDRILHHQTLRRSH